MVLSTREKQHTAATRSPYRSRSWRIFGVYFNFEVQFKQNSARPTVAAHLL